MHVTTRRMILTKHLHTFKNLNPRCICWHKDLRLFTTWCSIRICLNHGDHNLAARITSAGDIELLTVDHPLIAVEHRAGAVRQRQQHWRIAAEPHR